MIDVIKLLPESIANQIAAGEVVQRPASVVKELLENSVDAQARHIKLMVRESGKSLIQVVDDGVGMSPTDARMSFERHATSKIREARDIFNIRTMGFRGEALASIAAVACVHMKTRNDDAEIGTEIVIEGSVIKRQEAAAAERGTSLAVKNLFYNIPARRNFLKSNPVELKHITDEFFRVTLANADISFSMYNNDREVYRLEHGKLSKRIVQLFGKNHRNQLIPCQEQTPDIQITGYLGKPEFAKKTRGEQFFFVNGRFIKNNYLGHAVSHAFEGLVPDDFHPFYVLFLEMDPSMVDINVHPTKTEVKFQDERLFYGVIKAAATHALSQYHITPSLDFNADINFELSTQPADNVSKPDSDYTNFRTVDTQKRSFENWQELYRLAQKEEDSSAQAELELIEQEAYKLQSDLNAPTQNSEKKTNQSLQLHGQYLMRQVKSGVVIIDQNAAHERILFEKYANHLHDTGGSSQACLFPQHVPLNPADFHLVDELRNEIEKLGFDFETFGENDIVLNGIPADLAGTDGKEIFEGLLEQFKSNKETLELDHRQNLARSLASRTAVRRGRVLEPEEADELVDRLFACKQPNYTPGGSPVYVVLSLDRIGSYFRH